MNEFEWLRSLVMRPSPDAEWVDETRQVMLDAAFLTGLMVAAEPSAEDTAEARQRLVSLIDESSSRTRRGWKPGTRIGWTSSAAAVFVGLMMVGLIVLRPAPASGLLDVARATEVLPPNEFVGVQVVRTIEEEILVVDQVALNGETMNRVVYLLPQTQIRRRAADGSLQIETIPGSPVFFSIADDDRFREAVEEQIRPGFATIETYTRPVEPGSGVGLLTDDPLLLGQRLAEDIATHGDPGVPDSIETMERIANIYRAELPAPAARAALLRVLARLEGVEDASEGGGNGAAATLVHSARGSRERFTLQFDAAGWLVFEEILLIEGLPEIGVPAGVAMQRSHYEPPRLANAGG